MIFLVNLLWFICGGFLAWLGWMLAGAALAITVVGLPWAFAAFRIAPFAAWPFGRTLVDARVVGEGRIVGTGLANVLWIIFAGFWLTLAHIVAGVSLCLTIIGIPFGLAHFKLAEVSWAPLGKRIVDR
ncbi:YccF domain-containing protein [Gemmatimonas sp.]|uniref:YccF domain-containing protein n=1 Tax=Gemmatimonas sp. TaxID=1962908 RepID=UPI0025BE0D08|nr:YccF domain-containing protein [Gemmatimonas sp.]MCA2985044.1 YccF domain-containing protein [Gemmatimonas sp.]MCA2994986.1 YccF domain-containing protein [Gemmatimonas sp.]